MPEAHGQAGEAARSPLNTVRELVSRHALPLIVVVGGLVRFATIGTQEFWVDELATLGVIHRAPLDLLEAAAAGESNPGLYYLVAGGWERVLGTSEIGVRSLSAVVGTATIPVAYAAARELSSRRVGLIAAGLTATSPLLIWYSQEARNYELLVFLSALSFYFFVRSLQSDEERWLWGWMLSSSLGLVTHYFALGPILPEAAWLLIARPGRRTDTVFSIGAIGVVALALLPLVATQREHSAGISLFASLSERLVQVPEHFLVGLNVPWKILPALIGAAVVVVVVYGALRAEDRARRALALAGGIALLGFALALFVALVGSDYILSRNLLGLWVPAAVAVAAALGARALRPVGSLTAVVLCAVGLALAIWNAATPEARRADWSDLAAGLGDTRRERVIVSQSSFALPLVRYLDGTRVPPRGEKLSATELVAVDLRPGKDYALGPCWWGYTCGGRDPAESEPVEVPRGFRLKRAGTTPLFRYRVYRARKPVDVERPPQRIILPRVFVQEPS